MLERFNQYNETNQLFTPNDRLLVAVSGGIDSMVLIDLLKENGVSIAVAHCNFKLRARESDLDQLFVKEYCEQHAIPFHTISFQTKLVAEERKISTQMAARELRYDWFEDLLERHQLDKLVTAHHLNDQAETFFINLLRGSGPNGLSGIPIKSNRIIRPLSFATKKEIKMYADRKNLQYREDSSNADNKYVRNKIRLEIIPLLEELNPSFIPSAQKSMQLIAQAQLLINQEVVAFKKKFVTNSSKEITIDFDALNQTATPQLIAFELLSEYGFNSTQIEQIFADSGLSTGAILESETHVLLMNRSDLVISAKDHLHTVKEELIGGLVFDNKWLKGDVMLREALTDFPDGKTAAAFDADLIKKPLLINGWQNGDAFQPFGMNTFKKLSDFFVDEKLSIFQKDRVQLLRSNNEIVWVVGHRADNRFKITENTKQVWVVTRK